MISSDCDQNERGKPDVSWTEVLPELPETDLLTHLIARAGEAAFAPYRFRDGDWPRMPIRFLNQQLDCHGQGAAGWLGAFDLGTRAGLVRCPDRLAAVLGPLTAAARSCGTWWPTARFCTMVERPVRLRVDWPTAGRPRPHSPDGPALAWRDGWQLYAWRGLLVPGRPSTRHGRRSAGLPRATPRSAGR